MAPISRTGRPVGSGRIDSPVDVASTVGVVSVALSLSLPKSASSERLVSPGATTTAQCTDGLTKSVEPATGEIGTLWSSNIGFYRAGLVPCRPSGATAAAVPIAEAEAAKETAVVLGRRSPQSLTAVKKRTSC